MKGFPTLAAHWVWKLLMGSGSGDLTPSSSGSACEQLARKAGGQREEEKANNEE